MSIYMLFIFLHDSWPVGSPGQWDEWERHPIGKGGGEQKQVVFPTEREEIKHDIPLPTGCWFAMLSLSINLCLLEFFIIHLKWKNSFNTGSSQYCFCTIAWLSHADHQKNFGMVWIISLCLQNAVSILYAYHF